MRLTWQQMTQRAVKINRSFGTNHLQHDGNNWRLGLMKKNLPALQILYDSNVDGVFGCRINANGFIHWPR